MFSIATRMDRPHRALVIIPRGVLALALVSVAACATTRTRADEAFARHDYQAAADLYDQLVARAPDDQGMRARRAEARTSALATRAAGLHATRDRAALDVTLRELAALLATRDRWAGDGDPPTHAAIADEVTWARARLTAQIGGLVTAHRPLAAEAVLASRRAVLTASDFVSLWPTLTAEVRGAGRTICVAVTPREPERSPYLADLATRYCTHFGVAAGAPIALPFTIAGVAIDGEVRGMTAAQRSRLDQTVARVVAASPWAGTPGSPRSAAALVGSQAARFGVRPMKLDASWTETIPYQHRESYRESYQESYSDQESYTVQVPHFSSRTESYSCGYGSSARTCTRSVSHTDYRSETRHRTVTKYRTAYRDAWRMVTRYRHEPRVFSYQAIEQIADYDGDWRLEIPLGPAAAPAIATVVTRSHRAGIDHDVRFDPAGVMPSRANLPSHDDWFERLRADFETDLDRALASAWIASFCREPLYDLEAAARCTHGAATPPHAPVAALTVVFGAETSQVLALK